MNQNTPWVAYARGPDGFEYEILTVWMSDWATENNARGQVNNILTSNIEAQEELGNTETAMRLKIQYYDWNRNLKIVKKHEKESQHGDVSDTI